MNKTQIIAKALSRAPLIEVFTLLLTPSDRDQQEAADILCDLPSADLKTLREAVSRLDGLLDALALDRHLKRD